MILFNPVGKGTYWRALYLARGLAQRGNTVTVLATSPNRRFRFEIQPDAQPGVTLVASPDLLWGSLRFGWDLWNIVARVIWSSKQQFDLVHAFESRPVVIFPAIYWQRFRHTKLIMDWCDWFGRGGSVEERPNRLIRNLLRPFETFFEEHFRTIADGTTTINTTLRHRAITLGVNPETIKQLPNGSNIDELQPLSQREARQRLNWPQDIYIIGHIGAIFHKDAQLMAQSFNMIHQIEPNTKLLLAGYCNVNVEFLVNDPSAIIRTGTIHYDKVNIYLAACDICWLPLCDSGANQGRFPLKINDYMAVGKPVIVTDVGDAANLVRLKKFGLVSAAHPKPLAEQTLNLLHDPAQRATMGMLARQVAESDFSWRQISGQLERFYQLTIERLDKSEQTK